MNKNENINYNESLIAAYIAGELDKETESKVLTWINESDSNKAFYESIVKTWEISGKINPNPVVVDTENAWNTVRNRITNTPGKVVPINTRTNRRVYLSIAAMVIVLVGIFSLLNISQGSGNTIKRFAENGVLIDELSDGSTVSLNKNSSLMYLESFDDTERRVELKGEAFFEVSRDEEKPFIIDLPNETYVKVLGTSFNIKALEGDSLIEVYVKTGRVEFGNAAKNIVLTPGEKGVYNKNTDELKPAVQSSSEATELFWLNGKVKFDGTPLSEVITTLNQLFPDVRIDLNCDTAQNLPTIHLHNKGDSIEETMQSLAAIHHLAVSSKKEDRITFYTLSCNDF